MRLIDADALNFICMRCHCGDCIGMESEEYCKKCMYYVCGFEDIQNAPTVEARPVVHGEWLHVHGLRPSFRCSVCHSGYEMRHMSKFCPNCGARMQPDMRGNKNENTRCY